MIIRDGVKKLILTLILLLPLNAVAGGRAEIVQYLLSGITKPTGERCDGCKVYFCAAGTSTPKDVYTTYDKSTTASNPLTLSSQGIAKVYADGSYKFIIKDAAGNTLYTYDNLNFNYDRLETVAATTSGSGTAYTVSISPAPGSYYTHMTVVAKAHVVSGASPTLNVNGLGAKALKNSIGSNIAANDIAEDQVFLAYYDGTDFIVVDGAGGGSSSLAASGYYAGASTGAANTYVLNYTPDVEAYTDGRIYTFKAHQGNTGAATLQIDGLAAKSLRTADGAVLQGGEIQSGTNGPLFQVWYNSADDQFRLVDKRSEIYYGGTSEGSANTQTLTLSPALPAYKAGQVFIFIPGYKNTGAVSLNVNGLGAKSIKRQDGNDPAPGDLNTTKVIVLTYNGTNLVLPPLDDYTILSRGTVSTLTNSASETTVFSYTIPGNTIGTARHLVLKFYGQAVNNSGGNLDLTMKIKLGSTQLFTTGAIALGTNASGRATFVETRIVPLSATNSQRAFGEISHSAPSAAGGTLQQVISAYHATGISSATEDTTSDKDLVVTAQFSGSSNVSFTGLNGTVELQ